MIGANKLTRQIWESLQPLVPSLGDLNGLGLVEITASRHPHLIRMGHDLAQVFRMDCIKYIEEILSRWPFAFGPLIRKEDDELLVLRQARPQILDGKLIILGDLDVVHVLLLEQQLLVGEHLLQEVLGHLGLRRHVVLD